MPDGVEVVERAEDGVVGSDDGAVGEFFEDRSSGHESCVVVAVGVVAHFGGEGFVGVVEHLEFPASVFGEFGLVVGGVGRDKDDVGTSDEVGKGALEGVGPHRAERAGGAHVVDEDEVVVVAKEVFEGDGAVVGLERGLRVDGLGRGVFA